MINLTTSIEGERPSLVVTNKLGIHWMPGFFFVRVVFESQLTPGISTKIRVPLR